MSSEGIAVVSAMPLKMTSRWAATVSWGGATATDTFGQPAVGTQAALLWSATAFTEPIATLDKFEVGGEANNGGKIVSTYTFDGDDSENWNFNAFWANEGKDVNGYYAILTLNDAGDFASYTDMGSITGTTSTSPMQYKTYNNGWTTSEDSMYFGENGYTVAVGVPEPTSGLLLLLGVAGLALRRRRA